MTKKSEYIDLSDSELVTLWQKKRDEAAFSVLVERYYPMILKNLQHKHANPADAEESTQQVFMKLLSGLDNYKDEGKLANFLNTIARNTFFDFTKKHGGQSAVAGYEIENIADPTDNPELYASTTADIDFLTRTCIPQLPAKERLVFLLLHESTLWDYEIPLEWSHLAELNGTDVETAWLRFESARGALMKGASASDIEPEEILIFLIWTEAKRAFKSSHSLGYFAKLLGETEQNMRNRSFQAKKKLEQSMAQHAGAV